ncbi:MAG: DUF2703 domain-containing protein [Oscillospiraceae bacterium]|nr:DUF2703 domain-containing protein [Oscillospiraceae bacterium]
MEKLWYPVIDYAVCEDCGTCAFFCQHGVYDKSKAPSAVVINPNACVDHCHGCGNKCPTGAISYLGDDTGWMPPNGKQGAGEACCSCGCGENSKKEVLIEYLYLDLNTCERCIGTDKVLEEVISGLSGALRLAGYEIKYRKIEIETAELAKEHRFLSSPTIRVNEHDVCTSVSENKCDCCAEISGTDVDCRVFEFEGETYEVPPKELLAKAILKAVFGKRYGETDNAYELPNNLKAFFEGKNSKAACSCGGNCC